MPQQDQVTPKIDLIPAILLLDGRGGDVKLFETRSVGWREGVYSTSSSGSEAAVCDDILERTAVK